MYYKNIALDKMQMKKTCIYYKNIAPLMMQMKKKHIKKTAHLKMKMKKTV